MTFNFGISGRSSWNTHCLLTRAALPSLKIDLSKAVAVTELEDFLARGEVRVIEIALRYREQVRLKSGASNGSSRVNPHRIRTWADLATALRLNPKLDLQYVRALKTEELPEGTAHDPSREGPPGGLYVETAKLETIEAKEILCTFSDEPDWGMDQDLFPVAEYDYGSPPFGPPTGKSSQAAFHMAFLHGPRILRLFLPQIGTSFMAERVEVFLALSRLAFEKKIDYWGWRFAAWAMHYLQDLTQPYHASPFPLSLRSALHQIVRTRGNGSVSHRVGTLLKNHHLFFEAAVHFLLNDAAKKHEKGSLEEALASGRRHYEGPVRRVMEICSEVPAHLADSVDRTTVELFPALKRSDERTIPVDEAVEGIEEVVNRAKKGNPVYFDHWVELICRCLTVAGEVTRYTVKRASGAGLNRELD